MESDGSQGPIQRHMVSGPSSRLMFGASDVLRLITAFLAENSLPFSLVEHRLFKMLLSPDYVRLLPSRTKVARSLPETCDTVKKKIVVLIKVSHDTSRTADLYRALPVAFILLWTSEHQIMERLSWG